LRDIHKKTFEQLYDEMYSRTNRLKKGEDEEYKKQTNIQSLFPSFLIGPLLELFGFLGNIGLSNQTLSVYF
jgi:hypothetical protein